MQTSDNQEDGAPTRMFGWLPEVCGVALAAALLALLFTFAAGF